MVPVQIVGIRLDPITETSAVLLGEADNLTRVLPIMIGSRWPGRSRRAREPTISPRRCWR